VYVADMEDTCILGMDYLVSHRCVLDFCAMQLTAGDRSVPLRNVEHRRPCTPERQPCRPREKDQTKCRRATVEEPLEAPEVDIGRLQGKDAEEGCREGDARHVKMGSKRRRCTPPQLCQAGLSRESVAMGKASHADFKEGDQVWLYNPRRKKGQSPKLQSPWEGPYAVMERLTDVTYSIRGGRRTKPKTVHVNRLCKYHEPGNYTWDDHGGPGIDGGVVDGQEQDGDDERVDCDGGDL